MLFIYGVFTFVFMSWEDNIRCIQIPLLEQDGDVTFLRFLTFYKMIYRLKKSASGVFFFAL